MSSCDNNQLRLTPVIVRLLVALLAIPLLRYLWHNPGFSRRRPHSVWSCRNIRNSYFRHRSHHSRLRRLRQCRHGNPARLTARLRWRSSHLSLIHFFHRNVRCNPLTSSIASASPAPTHTAPPPISATTKARATIINSIPITPEIFGPPPLVPTRPPAPNL